jgi:hypothetical protein
VAEKKSGYVVVNLMREFLAGFDKKRSYYHWTNDYNKAMLFKDLETAIGIVEPIALKAYIVGDYGMTLESEVYKNFSSGKGLQWGRWGQDDNDN